MGQARLKTEREIEVKSEAPESRKTAEHIEQKELHLRNLRVVLIVIGHLDVDMRTKRANRSTDWQQAWPTRSSSTCDQNDVYMTTQCREKDDARMIQVWLLN